MKQKQFTSILNEGIAYWVNGWLSTPEPIKYHYQQHYEVYSKGYTPNENTAWSVVDVRRDISATSVWSERLAFEHFWKQPETIGVQPISDKQIQKAGPDLFMLHDMHGSQAISVKLGTITQLTETVYRVAISVVVANEIAMDCMSDIVAIVSCRTNQVVSISGEALIGLVRDGFRGKTQLVVEDDKVLIDVDTEDAIFGEPKAAENVSI